MIQQNNNDELCNSIGGEIFVNSTRKTVTNDRQSWQFCKNIWSPIKKLVVFGTPGQSRGESLQKQDESNLKVEHILDTLK